tara:strand:+ start:1732 stop:2295 length:564 start_codon:yes stop_codon:yes gene_type:complete
MATLKLNSQTVVTESSGTLTAPALNITTGTLASGITFPAGHAVQTVFEETDTVSGITNTTPPGDVWLSKSITPLYSDSKILISVQFSYGKEDGYTGYTRLYRDSTWIYPYTSDRGFSLRGGSTGWGVAMGHIQYLDTPGSGTFTYKCYSYTTHASYPMYINKNWNNNQDGASGGRSSSSILLMEIKQ